MLRTARGSSFASGPWLDPMSKRFFRQASCGSGPHGADSWIIPENGSGMPTCSGGPDVYPAYCDRTGCVRTIHRATALDTRTGEILDAKRPGGIEAVTTSITGITADHGPVAVAYEAGPTGFSLALTFADLNYPVTVAAPSKLLRPSGDKVKTGEGHAQGVQRVSFAHFSSRFLIAVRGFGHRIASGAQRAGEDRAVGG